MWMKLGFMRKSQSHEISSANGSSSMKINLSCQDDL